MRAVLDPNVLAPGVLSPTGPPGRLLRAWHDGRFDLVLSVAVLDELQRVLTYPKLRKRITEDQATRYVAHLARLGEVVDDPVRPPTVRSPDPDDDYLVAIAEQTRSAIVSGDHHLLDLADRIPVFTPRAWLERLDG